MSMRIGDKINQNLQLQEFVERALSMVFDQTMDDEDVAEDFCDEMGVTQDEMWWMFKELGYEREED